MFHQMKDKNVICTNASVMPKNIYFKKTTQKTKQKKHWLHFLFAHKSTFTKDHMKFYIKDLIKLKKMNGMKLLVLNLEKVSLQEQKVPVSYNSKLDLVNVGNHSG